ncbi:flagellar hook-basal body complex protein [Clostridium sp.]|uniref:flagellar hook-basal body complex protein n=1 Tax=Clostridium sp. TaxID=1506 RepID=UPI001B69171F|nr:flagellar hook-basal body complex protein [Clostridium sp.]MBP3917383.1 flagellar hook-basal body complex protein [Clostridium sp.]
MLRSLYSGISGMKVNQTKLDVIGNNIANVGTTSFKGSRVTFSDMLSQNVQGASSPTNNQGGINASQVGLGVQLASINKVMTQGVMQSTGRALDVGIDGEGFFLVSKGPAIYEDSVLEVSHQLGNHTVTQQSLTTSNSELMYTRDGSFTLDESGNLLTSDGFRVLGYSLTNDDNSKNASANSPSNVSAGGFEFNFGPGSQLNGYKVVLGAIGPGTATAATINKADKVIVVNGDFSTSGALSSEQVESAINKSLSSNGISQNVYVSGKPITIANAYSENITGGADATAPGSVTIAGATLQFSEGSELNGYSFSIREVGSGTTLSAEVDSAAKKIYIDGDFVNKGAISGGALRDVINTALAVEGIDQSITSITGTPSNIANISTATDSSGVDLKAIGQKVNKSASALTDTFGGLTFNFEEGGQLNDYTIKYGDVTSGSISTVLNKADKTITISGNLTAVDALTDLKASFNNELARTGITSNKLIDVTGTFNADDATNTLTLSGGSDLKAPKSVDLSGVTLNFPKGSAFNDVKIEVTNVKDTKLSATYDPASKTFSISGDFVTPNAITAANLAKVLNDAADASGAFGTIGNTNKITATGTVRTLSGLNSTSIEGGIDFKTPSYVEVGGMVIDFTDGGELNGYTIQFGNIERNVATSAKIDSTNKKIIINADLTTGGIVSSAEIQNVINFALQEKGINQSVIVTGEPMHVTGIESTETSGGTPVQSIENDGTINFVDASKTLKSYDENLKTLRIPDKVRVAGSDTELAVMSFSIDKYGVINGVLEDGRVAALGQIAMATFKNPEGLVSLGGNLYGGSVNSGEASIKSGVGTLGDDNSKGYGDNLQGKLEMSNVDLAEQFTDMIVTTRAFQAASKTINTSDEILQDIINLKR